ncbi:synapsin-1-like [Artibeus jamaicensis]|uniref:synapsin-1-like n=1 Tax=Artibeus jamaicensis TaxID=9417 RepID=UPI00235B2D09|nr:synapsin-1-like [Artibeus jamaicensis]
MRLTDLKKFSGEFVICTLRIKILGASEKNQTGKAIWRPLVFTKGPRSGRAGACPVDHSLGFSRVLPEGDLRQTPLSIRGALTPPRGAAYLRAGGPAGSLLVPEDLRSKSGAQWEGLPQIRAELGCPGAVPMAGQAHVKPADSGSRSGPCWSPVRPHCGAHVPDTTWSLKSQNCLTPTELPWTPLGEARSPLWAGLAGGQEETAGTDRADLPEAGSVLRSQAGGLPLQTRSTSRGLRPRWWQVGAGPRPGKQKCLPCQHEAREPGELPGSGEPAAPGSLPRVVLGLPRPRQGPGPSAAPPASPARPQLLLQPPRDLPPSSIPMETLGGVPSASGCGLVSTRASLLSSSPAPEVQVPPPRVSPHTY